MGCSSTVRGMPRAIVFDLFNTVVSANDFMPPDFRRAQAAAEIIGADLDAFSAFWWSGDAYGRYRCAEPDVLGWVERFLGRGLTEPERGRLDHVLGAYQDRALAQPRTDALEALDAFRTQGLRLGLLSNADEREVRTWHASPLRGRFDVAFFSCHEGCAKPEPEAFAWVLDRLEVPANEAVFVGDGMSEELPGARAAGFGTVVFMQGFLIEHGIVDPALRAAHADKSDFVIDRLEDLQTVL